MSKKKKIIITIVVILLIVVLMAGGIFAYLQHQKNSMTADVYSVADLNWYYGGDEMTSYGMVTNDHYQDVYLLQEQAIAEVFVVEGQEVKVGDPLLAYDMTLTDLQLEMQELEVENIKNKLILASRNLEKLKMTTPIPEQTYVPEMPQVEEEEVLPPYMDGATGAYNYILGSMSGIIKIYDGDGTEADPFVVLCMPNCYVEGDYLNQLAAQEVDLHVRFQMIDPEKKEIVQDMFWEISSHQLAATGMTFEAESRWSVETKMPVTDVVEEEFVEEEIIVMPEVQQGYTAAELAAAIQEAEKTIKNLDLQKRQAELRLEQMKKVSEDGIVTATVDGTVKSVGDMEHPPIDGSPFLSITGSEGLYVSGTLTELQLEEVQLGQIVYANSWESGMSFEAIIQEISPYPTDSSNSWGEGNPNVSYYPYVAYIENTDGLKNGEYVDLTMTAMYSEEDASSIYLEKAYVREEDGRSYVLKADENDRLVKQYVETGKTIYGEAIEIKSGLTLEDRIAFPYGKTAKEGIRVEDFSNSGIMYY